MSIQSFPPSIRIGTRGSALAMWQATAVQTMIHERFPESATELATITPHGDVDKHSSLRQIGGRGVFTSALQQHMLAGDIDLAVHSTKDLPSLAPHGIGIAAFPQREDARDALISRHGVGLESLPPNPVIGTSSRRRAVQLLKIRPDAIIHDLRGNIDTRLRKGLSDEYDAVILAAAGLTRLGWQDQITEMLPLEVSCPAPGQGALAIEARTEDTVIWEIATELDDADIRAAVMVERAFLRGVGGGCSTPIGAHAEIEHVHGLATVRFWAMLGSDDGDRLERLYTEWPVDGAVGRAFDAADELMRMVAPKWSGTPQMLPLQDRRVLLTGSEAQVARLQDSFAPTGAFVEALPTIAIESRPVDLPEAMDWLVVTSKHAVPSIDWSRVTSPVAVVGEATAAAVRAAGIEPAITSAGPGASQLAADLNAHGITGKTCVHVTSDIGRDELRQQLVDAGVIFKTIVGYRTIASTEIDPELRAAIAAGTIEAVTFSSPSSVKAFVTLIGADLPALSGAAMIAIGPTTAAAMRSFHLPVHATAAPANADGLCDAVISYFGRSQEEPTA